MKLTRVVIYFQDHGSAVEHMNDLIDKPPKGATRWRILAPRYFGQGMTRRTSMIVLSALGIAVVALVAGFLWN